MTDQNEKDMLERQRKEREAMARDRGVDGQAGIVGERPVGEKPGMNPAATNPAEPDSVVQQRANEAARRVGRAEVGTQPAGQNIPDPVPPKPHHERYEHPERSQQPDPSPTANQQAEEVQRRANRKPHSERTVNGGKTLP